jgi:hypothetical protein
MSENKGLLKDYYPSTTEEALKRRRLMKKEKEVGLSEDEVLDLAEEKGEK